MRDRDVKLRVYPGIAPMLMMPFIFLLQGGRSASTGGFGIAFSGYYLGLIPLMGLSMLQYSQQWHAADVFRAAPLPGPAPLCHGARRAVLFFLTLPLLLVFAVLAFVLRADSAQLLLLLPGVIALPVYALIPSLRGGAVPFSVPTEEAKSAGRGLSMIGVMLISMVLAFLTSWSWSQGLFWWVVLVETVVVLITYSVLRLAFVHTGWKSME